MGSSGGPSQSDQSLQGNKIVQIYWYWSCLIHNMLQLLSELGYFLLIPFSLQMIVGMLGQSASARSLHYKSGLQLHRVLQQFKEKESHKSTLQNKINVLHRKYESSQRKAKNIHSSILRINEVKQHFQQQKQAINQSIRLQKENQEQRVAQSKEQRENSKEHLEIVLDLMASSKQEQYKKVKKLERINTIRILQEERRSLHSKRQKSLEIKLKEEESKLAKTIFLETKRLRAQRNSEKEILPLQLGIIMNQRQLESMRLLESQMVEKLNKSRATLSRSKLSLKRAE